MDRSGRLKETSPTATLVSLTVKESSLLDLLRSNRYSRIEIEMKNGEINKVYVDEELIATNARLDDIVKSNAFQTVTVTRHDGNVVRIKRRIPVRFGE